MGLKMKKIFFLLLLFYLPCIAQDYDRILSELPPIGSYAEYKITDMKDEKSTTKTVKVSVTKKEVVDGDECLFIEIYPFAIKIITTKVGTLGILLKKDATLEEKKNFILRSKKIFFAEEGKEPYEVERSVLDMLKSESKDFKIEKNEREVERKLVEFKDKVKREVRVIESKIVLLDNDGEKHIYKGTIEISKEIPFGLINEDFIVKKFGKKGECKKVFKSKIELIDFSYEGAKSAFPDKKIKKKGLWGIIFS